MSAHAVALAAAALTTLIAAALATALAVFAGQALPLAARHDLAAAPGTAIYAAGPVAPGRAGPDTAALAAAIRRALPGVPFRFAAARWSDPLDLVPGARPARPATAGTSIAVLQAASFPALPAAARLVSGTWPGPPAAGQPIPAALPAAATALLHVSAGQLLRLRDRVTGRAVTFRLTGVYRPDRAAGTYPGLDTISPAGATSLGGFTTYGPLAVSPAAFAGAGPLPVASGSWLARPDMTRFTDAGLTARAALVAALRPRLAASATLNGIQLRTRLPGVLDDTAAGLSVARSLLVIGLIQLLLLAGAALAATARLLAGQQEAEAALLTARGATRGQLGAMNAAGIVPLAVTAAAAGGLAGIGLAGLLARTGPLGAARLALPGLNDAGLAAAAVCAAVTAVLAAVLLLLPTRRRLTRRTARLRRSRRQVLAGAARAGADVALVALALLAGWQLRRYSALPAAAGGPGARGGLGGIDPVLAVAPALALAGGTVTTLRLLPAGARAGDRLAARGRRLNVAMASWQVSREPLRQGGTALLIVLAVATGTLALAQHASWLRSASDQAAFAAGADVRVDLPGQPGPGRAAVLAATPGVARAMAVSAQPGSSLLALDARQAAATVRLRADEAPVPAARLFREITPPPPAGVALPSRSARVRLTATLTAPGLAPVSVSLTVMDTAGDVYQLPAGSLPADGRPHVLSAPLGGGGRPGGRGLRLIAVTAAYTLPAASPVAATLTVSAVGPRPGRALGGWTPAVTSPELVSVKQAGDVSPQAGPPGVSSWQATPAGGQALAFSTGYGQGQTSRGRGVPPLPRYPLDGQIRLTAAAPRLAAAIPGLATRSFLSSTSLRVGAVAQEQVNGVPVAVRIVAAVREFPTVTGGSGGLVVDLPGLQELLAARSGTPVGVNQWWLATAGHRVPPGLAATLPGGSSVTSQRQLAAALTADPLTAAPQQALLATAAAAALLALTGSLVSIAAGLRHRRGESAVLAALGVSPRSAAGQLGLEKLLLSLPAAILGLALGTVVADLIVPAVTLTPVATRPVPPAVTLLDLAQTVPLALAVGALPALAAMITILRRPDPAVQLRAADPA